MDSSHVAEEIVDYLPLLTQEQQEALLHVARAFVEASPEPEVKVSDEYAKEIQRRFRELESGADPGVSWEEVKRRGRELLAKR